MHPAISDGHVAVITGGASGIGYACAQRFSALGMRVCLADRDADALAKAVAGLPGEAFGQQTNVAELAEVEGLRDAVLSRFGAVHLLMNNAGTGGGGGAFTRYAGWQKVLGVNLWGVINGVQTFTELMLAQQVPAAIINTGSKQGITNPPGDAAYNLSKAGVRSLTESLAYELRNTPDCQISAHLLVPGFTYTGMIQARVPNKPAAAWSPEQVAELLLQRMSSGDFYILCPDNDVTASVDHARIQWNTDDVRLNRPALSRWHPDYAEVFADFVANSID